MSTQAKIGTATIEYDRMTIHTACFNVFGAWAGGVGVARGVWVMV